MMDCRTSINTIDTSTNTAITTTNSTINSSSNNNSSSSGYGISDCSSYGWSIHIQNLEYTILLYILVTITTIGSTDVTVSSTL